MSTSKMKGVEDSLLPTPSEKRALPVGVYLFTLFGAGVAIQGFVLGAFTLPPAGPLNITQAVVAILIVGAVMGAAFSFNGTLGLRTGIPFAIQSHYSFGRWGGIWPQLLRALPAIFWLGIGTWIGALAANGLTTELFGWGNVYIYFVILTIIQAIISWWGIRGIGYISSVMGVALVAMFIYFLVAIFQTRTLELQEAWLAAGSWGLPFIAVISTLLAVQVTGFINIGDLTRHLKPQTQRTNFLANYLSFPIGYLFILFMGIITAAIVMVADPVEALMAIAPSTGMGLALLFFVFFAQFTTNTAYNILPPALVLQDIFKKLSWRWGVGITCALSLATFPWVLLTSTWFFPFVNYIGAFLAPVVVVLLFDYWGGLHRLDVKEILDQFYGERRKKHFRGVSFDGIIAVIIGGIVGIVFLQYSTFASAAAAVIAYPILRAIGIDERLRRSNPQSLY